MSILFKNLLTSFISTVFRRPAFYELLYWKKLEVRISVMHYCTKSNGRICAVILCLVLQYFEFRIILQEHRRWITVKLQWLGMRVKHRVLCTRTIGPQKWAATIVNHIPRIFAKLLW